MTPEIRSGCCNGTAEAAFKTDALKVLPVTATQAGDIQLQLRNIYCWWSDLCRHLEQECVRPAIRAQHGNPLGSRLGTHHMH